MVACKVKPFQLVNRESLKNRSKDSVKKKQVMLLDDLEDIENLMDIYKDVIRVKYLRMQNSVSFSELYSFVVELPVLEHWRPEVKLAKKNEVKNLMDYKTFEEIEDIGQKNIGSQKERHDGQKQQTKVRLVAHGF